MNKHSSEDGASESVWKCGNCRNIETEAPDSPQDLCPDCRVEKMEEMEQEKCPSCENTTFRISSGGGFTTQPSAVCTGCGRTAEVDEDGLWW